MPVLEREIDRCIEVRSDGKVLVVVKIVEAFGQETQSCTEFEGQLDALVGNQRLGDEGINGKHASQRITHLGILLEIEPEVGMVESDADIRIIINRFPIVPAVSALVDRSFKGWIVGVEFLHLEMMVPKGSCMYAGLHHEVVV